MKKLLPALAKLLLALGFVGFAGGGLIGTGAFDYDGELPLSDIKGFVVDDNGHVYVGLGFYGMIQAYDANGKFIKNWRVKAVGGTFTIQLTEDHRIFVQTARGNNKLWFNRDGNIVAEEVRHTKYAEIDSRWDSYTSEAGVTYAVKGGMFPRIENSTHEKVVVSQGILFHMLKGPFPAWLFIALGTGLRFWLAKEERELHLKR